MIFGVEGYCLYEVVDPRMESRSWDSCFVFGYEITIDGHGWEGSGNWLFFRWLELMVGCENSLLLETKMKIDFDLVFMFC